MGMFINVIAVGIGGFAGSVLRYLISASFPYKGGFPWATLSINLVGSFLLALLSQLLLNRLGVSEPVSLMLRVGLCGGFTTFSTFSVETLSLLENGQWGIALLYVLLSCVLGVAMAVAGTHLGQLG